MTAKPRYPKSTCCIPGCQRWSTLFPTEWMCAPHWRMVPRKMRKHLRALWRETNRLAGLDQQPQPNRPALVREWRRRWRQGDLMWDLAKRRVIFRAAGI